MLLLLLLVVAVVMIVMAVSFSSFFFTLVGIATANGAAVATVFGFNRDLCFHRYSPYICNVTYNSNQLSLVMCCCRDYFVGVDVVVVVFAAAIGRFVVVFDAVVREESFGNGSDDVVHY